MERHWPLWDAMDELMCRRTPDLLQLKYDSGVRFFVHTDIVNTIERYKFVSSRCITIRSRYLSRHDGNVKKNHICEEMQFLLDVHVEIIVWAQLFKASLA